ncbi:hypothetical protein [Thermoactinospora rubra]|uniref:hypothetical protein n=1 Tax=Thermoactinospora rubra TaxID=1088767 RepID=UPI00146FC562|nr:hypothetical protein [Thermoactinospora rubra]
MSLLPDNWAALALVFVGLFLVGGVVSFVKQGMRVGALICGIGAALAITGAVLWW